MSGLFKNFSIGAVSALFKNFSIGAVSALLLLLGALLALVLAWNVGDALVATAIITGCAFAAVIVLGGTIALTPDDTRSEATERTLRVASNTLGHLHGGLTVENARAICAMLLPETSAEGIAITDTETVLAFEGTIETPFVPGTPNAKPTLEVLESRRMETFVSVDQESQDVRPFSIGNRRQGHAFGIIVPLLVQDRAVGTIKLYYRRDNTLNTIASFTRTNPTKARDLLREFSVFYRRTLESSEKTLIPLSQELEQTRRYLKIEKARFGEERIRETEHVEKGCDELPVPSFLVQPIVENAVRHAMRDDGPLHIDVQVATDGDDILIAVADDGLGMDKAVADRLLAEATEPRPEEADRAGAGTGMALRNVAERIERFFGVGSDVEIVSKPGEGTCVTLRLAGARRTLVSTEPSR